MLWSQSVLRSIISNYSKTTGKLRDTEQLLVTVRLLCWLRIQRSGFGRLNGAVNASGEAHNSAYADDIVPKAQPDQR